MSEFYSLLKNNYQDIEVINVISTLWSGCGEIIRCRLDDETRVIKLISMPDFIEHSRIEQSQFALARKQQSYLVEYNWYKQYSSSLPDQAAAIPCFNLIQKQNQFALIFDDFTAFGYQQAQDHTQHIHAILKWLAHFHAFHLSTPGEGLWPRGSYWHLATRPDEYARMPDSPLKAAAVHIDCALYKCKYQTLIHGDAKRANFAINSQTNHVLGYDFQYAGKGVGVIDVMYFLGSCLNESALKLNAHTYLNRYFAELNTALKQYQGTINADDLISSWRELWCYAWADFYRFLAGWSPQHVKINGYMQNQFNEYLNKNKEYDE